jgi:phage head maturation protease
MGKQIFYRDLQVRKDNIDEEKRTVELSFSSEEPYERYFGNEILGHKPNEVRMERLLKTGPLLLDHDYKKQIGKVETADIKNKRGIATVRFSRSSLAEEIFQDVLDGIRENISVGYQLYKLFELDEKGEDDIEQYRAVDWEPHEISIVSMPADMTVGIGRSLNDLENVEIIKGEKSCQKKTKLQINMKLT